jgi:hypothetical protein
MSEFTQREQLEISKNAYERVLNTISEHYVNLLNKEAPSNSEIETREYLAERVNFLFQEWIHFHNLINSLPPIIDVTLPSLLRKD